MSDLDDAIDVNYKLINEIERLRTMLREIVELYDFCADMDSPIAELVMDKARGMI